jgi:cyclic-di-GMP phosphodiesterase, flagellum assembly factor TipF
VRFGQGFLFAAPRPLRPETSSATGSDKDQHAAAPPAPDIRKTEAPRSSGLAALARRAVGPG